VRILRIAYLLGCLGSDDHATRAGATAELRAHRASPLLGLCRSADPEVWLRLDLIRPGGVIGDTSHIRLWGQ
jgi:hypothetical protein